MKEGWHAVDRIMKTRKAAVEIGTGLPCKEGAKVVQKTYLQLGRQDTSQSATLFSVGQETP